MTQVSFFELFFSWVFPLHSLEGFRTRGEIDFTLVLKYFFDFLESQISLLVFVGASFVFKLKLPEQLQPMQHLIFTPKNADKSSCMATDSNDKKIHTHAHQRNQE